MNGMFGWGARSDWKRATGHILVRDQRVSEGVGRKRLGETLSTAMSEEAVEPVKLSGHESGAVFAHEQQGGSQHSGPPFHGSRRRNPFR